MTYVVERGALHLPADRDNQDEPGIDLLDQPVANAVGIEWSGQRYRVDRESAEQWAARHQQELPADWQAHDLERVLFDVALTAELDRLADGELPSGEFINRAGLGGVTGTIEQIRAEGTAEDRDWAIGQLCLLLAGQHVALAKRLTENISDQELRDEIRCTIDLRNRIIHPGDPEEALNLMIEAVGGPDKYNTLPEIDGREFKASGRFAPGVVTHSIMKGVDAEGRNGRQFIVVALDDEKPRLYYQRAPRRPEWICSFSIADVIGRDARVQIYHSLKELCTKGETKTLAPNGTISTERLSDAGRAESAGKT
jgi:hypothetical protein